MEKKETAKNKRLSLKDDRKVLSDGKTLKKQKTGKPLGMFKKKEKQRPFALSLLFTTMKVMLVFVILAGVACAGVVLGIAKAYIDTTPMLDLAALTDSSKTSYIYDANGEVLCTYAGSEYRDWADIEDIPDMLKNAVIAIEDVRFRDHSGIDYKRLFSAIVNTFRNEDTHGGSTITQQLIKNTILSDVQSYKRKIQEAYLALELETLSDKDSILEAYLNEVYFGDRNYGIKAAAKDYFGKELNELTIRECAMLAGMIQKPNGYNPRLNTYVRIDSVTGENKMDRTNNRTDLVLRAMYDAGFISLEQLEKALEEEVEIIEESSKTQGYKYTYFIEYAISDVEAKLLEQRGWADTPANRSLIETELRTGGYHIYLTIDPEIQEIVEEEVRNYSNYPELEDPDEAIRRESNGDGTYTEIIEPQAAAVVIDHNTGNIVAIIGGRSEPTAQKQWNRAYMSKLEVGSSIKPLSVYGPALDLGLSPATPIYNIPARIDGWNTDAGYPAIASETDIVSVRRGIRSSLNVVAARILMNEVGLDAAKEYLVNLGIPAEQVNEDGPGLALGTTGITPIQMAGAYATIANNGVYQEPLSFTKVVDSDGRIILDATQNRDVHRVYKESTAWLLTDMMEGVVESGTGTRADFSGMTVAGKTGTNSDYSSVCFSGFTSYYAATVWIGHDYPENKLEHGSSGGRYAAPLWKNFMERIHEGLDDRQIQDSSVDKLNIVKRTVCAVSGQLATDACHSDTEHPPITDWFYSENVPQEQCTMHAFYSICTESGLIACDACPNKEEHVVIVLPKDSPLKYFREAIFPNTLSDVTAVCTLHDSGALPTPPDDGGDDDGDDDGGNDDDTDTVAEEYAELIDEAKEVTGIVREYLNNPNFLSDREKADLTIRLLAVETCLKSEKYTELEGYLNKLKEIFTAYTGEPI